MNSKAFEFGYDEPSVFVVGVNGSDTSWRALYYAFGLGRRQHCTVIAVFAMTHPAAQDTTMVGGYEANSGLAAELKPAIQALATDYQVKTRFMCLPGDPVSTLIDIAAEHRADGIFVGSGQGFGRRLFGSNAVRTVRRGHCPVTVVP